MISSFNLNDLINHLLNYLDEDVIDLKNKLNISSNAKSINYILSSKMCYSYKGKELFENFAFINNIHVKTIQLKENGKAKEAMSFAPIDYQNIVLEKWETSTFKKYLDGTFIFFVFKKQNEKNILKKIFSWKMNADDKNNVKLIWENTKNLISEGKAFNKMSDGKFYTNFLGEAKTEICHVRPHGKDSTDFRKIPVQDIKSGTFVLPKYSFWFNHEYLNKIVNEKGETK